MDDSKVFMFPEKGNSGIDASTALLLGNGGGFGNGFNNPLWMMFMWPLMYPFMNMFGGWGNGFGGNNGGAGFLANQLNNDAGRDLIVQAINGRADALGQLAQLTHSDVNSVRDAISIVNSKLGEVGSQVGMSGLQVINSIQSGNASIAQQLANCCLTGAAPPPYNSERKGKGVFECLSFKTLFLLFGEELIELNTN